MKEKILASIKTKYKHLGFGEKAINGVVNYIEQTVTSEDQIDTATNGLEGLLKAFQSEFDSVRTENKALKELLEKSKKDQAEKKEETVEKKSTDNVDEMPAWAKAVIESNQNIAKELAGIKSNTVAQSRKQILEQKLGDVPEKLRAKAIKDFERMQFDSEDSFSSYVEETVTDYKDFAQLEKEQSAGANSTPFLPTGGKIGETEVSPMMKAFINNRTKAVEAAQAAKAV